MNTPLVYCRGISEINFSSWDFTSGLSFSFHIERRRAWSQGTPKQTGSSAVMGCTLGCFLTVQKLKIKILSPSQMSPASPSNPYFCQTLTNWSLFNLKYFLGEVGFFLRTILCAAGETCAPRKIAWFNYQNKAKLRASVYKMRVQFKSNVQLPPTCVSCGRLQPSWPTASVFLYI